MQKTEKSIYFSGINSLRFFAALAVIITHIELLKASFGFKNHWSNPLIFNLGGMGVYFFFVLSGFLITYLLLAEKTTYHKIQIKQFYIRRVLRIWPLYYLIVILGFFILPHFKLFQVSYLQNSFTEHFGGNLILYVLILPNLAFSLFSPVPNIGQLWSIGVEEQFYLVWPWVIDKSKHILKTLIILIICLILFKALVLFSGRFYAGSAWYPPFKLFIAMSKFECMAIGGIGAHLLFVNSKFLKFLYNKYLLVFSFIGIPACVYITPAFLQDGIHIIYSLLFLIIILNVSNNTLKINSENRLLNYLGKISYGIYMYHFMVISAVLYLLKKYGNLNSETAVNLISYSSVIIITILISGISYRFIERPFINLKGKFSPIKSGS